MSFDPSPKQELVIEGTIYQVTEHPAAPGIAYGQEGRAAIVYKVEAGQRAHALKVFKTRFRVPTLAMLADQLAPYASIPGLSVCRRSVLTPQRHTALLRQYPDLTYSVLMPWVEGPTWLQIVQERQALTPEQSLFLGQSFARILAELEQQGIAHCDLSAANLILPVLAPKSEQNSSTPIELVDVEQLYAASLKRPAAVPSGSEGYAHLSVRQGAWEDKADRFAGAVLLAEMLGWCDPQVREAAWGESYFAPQEMQRPCPRFDLLRSSLAAHWGDGTAQLLANAWNSELLADCPTFGEWMVAIPEVIAPKETSPQDQNPTVKVLIALAEQMTAQGNLPDAIETYRSALALLPANSPAGKAIAEQMQTLAQQQAVAGDRRADPAPVPPGRREEPAPVPESSQACPHCGKIIPAAVTVCPYCERKLADQVESAPGADKPTRGTPALPARPPEDRPLPPETPKKKPKKKGAVLPVILVLGAVLVLVIAGFLSQALKPTAMPPAALPGATPAAQEEPTQAPAVSVATAVEPAPTEPAAPSNLAAKIAFFSYRDGTDNLYMMGADGSGQTPVTFWDGFEKSPVWSPNGTEIAYSTISDLWIMDENGSTARQLTFDGIEKYPGGFSPDGRFLYYEMGSSTHRLDLDTGQSTLVIEGARSPAVSPDGTAIAFWNSGGFYVANIDGSGQRLITADATQTWMKSIAWYPDGTIVACVSANNDIKGFSLDGTEVANLTGGQGNHTSPAFSPDGTLISFTSDRDGNNEIYVLHLGTGQLTRLTDDPANDDGAVWRPGLPAASASDEPVAGAPAVAARVVTDPLLFLGEEGARFVDPIGGAELELIENSTGLRFSVPNYRRDLDPFTNLGAPRLIIKTSQGMETRVQTRIQSAGFQAAGLLAWINEGNFIWFGPSSPGLCAGVFINYVNSGNSENCRFLNTDTVTLRIEREANSFILSYSLDDQTWQHFNTIDYLEVPELISGGLFLINQWEDVPYSADFYYFKNLPAP